MSYIINQPSRSRTFSSVVHGAITHSGTALDEWAIHRDRKNFTARLVDEVGCAETPLELKECFKEVVRILRVSNTVFLLLKFEFHNIYYFIWA